MMILFLLLLAGCAAEKIPLQANQVRIRPGDNLEVMANKYKLTVLELVTFNGLKYPYSLKVGDVLNLPVNIKADEVEGINNGPLFGPNAIGRPPALNTPEELSVEEKSKNAVVKHHTQETKSNEQAEQEIEPKHNKNQTKVSESKKTDKVKDKKSTPAENKDKTSKAKMNQKPKQEVSKQIYGPVHVEQETFIPPLQGFTNITQKKNPKTLRLKPKDNPNVYSVYAGEIFVSDKFYPEMGGRVIVVKHVKDGEVYLSVYGGMKTIAPGILTKKTKFVNAGDIIGDLGQTRDKRHVLNFELRKGNRVINPDSVIDAFKK